MKTVSNAARKAASGIAISPQNEYGQWMLIAMTAPNPAPEATRAATQQRVEQRVARDVLKRPRLIEKSISQSSSLDERLRIIPKPWNREAFVWLADPGAGD